MNKFAKIYLIVMAVFLTALMCFFTIYWFNLDTFEKSNPENVAAKIFKYYFYELAFNKLYELEKPFLSKLETFDNYVAYLSDKTKGGEFRYLHVETDIDSDDVKRYFVFSDNDKFAEFELKRSTRFGKQIWKISFIISAYKKFDTFKIIVPEGQEVFVNDKLLDKNYKTGAAVQNHLAGSQDIYTIEGLISEPLVEVRHNKNKRILKFDSDENVFTAIPVFTADLLNNYTLYINNFEIDDSFLLREVRTGEADRLKLTRKIYRVPFGLGEPNIRIVGKTGAEGKINKTGEFNFVQEIIYNNELETQFRQHAISTAQTYALFMTNNARLADLANYFDTTTTLYTGIRTSEVYFFTPHARHWFSNVVASEFFDQGNGAFSSRVAFDQYFQRTAGGETFMFHLDITLFIREINGRYLVYDMLVNS